MLVYQLFHYLLTKKRYWLVLTGLTLPSIGPIETLIRTEHIYLPQTDEVISEQIYVININAELKWFRLRLTDNTSDMDQE